jgi:hypothetical protein
MPDFNPDVGDELNLLDESHGRMITVEVMAYFGAARVIEVKSGEATGIMAIRADGKFWWIRDLEEPEPWKSHG